MPRMIILDRDGVINQDSDAYIKNADEWIPVPGSLDAIKRLKKAGYLVTVASNQSGMSRGLFSEDDLREIDKKMHQMLAAQDTGVDGIFYCRHGPKENCLCRKPQPGLLFDIADKYNIDLSVTPFVGDSLVDIKAAEKANAIPILVRTGKGEKVMRNHPEAARVPVYDDLAHFVRETLDQRD